MKALVRVALPVVALLGVIGCGGSSSSSDDCDKACAHVESCATTLGTDIETLLQIPGVTPSNCATGCRQQKSFCADASAFLTCTKELTCPATVSAARSAIEGCYSEGGCPAP